MSLRQLIERIRRLEQATRTTGPLAPAEAAELAMLEREHARRFPGEVEAWSEDQLDDYLRNFATGADYAERLDQLRRRAGFFDLEA